jgi:hypothetical protein
MLNTCINHLDIIKTTKLLHDMYTFRYGHGHNCSRYVRISYKIMKHFYINGIHFDMLYVLSYQNMFYLFIAFVFLCVLSLCVLSLYTFCRYIFIFLYVLSLYVFSLFTFCRCTFRRYMFCLFIRFFVIRFVSLYICIYTIRIIDFVIIHLVTEFILIA